MNARHLRLACAATALAASLFSAGPAAGGAPEPVPSTRPIAPSPAPAAPARDAEVDALLRALDAAGDETGVRRVTRDAAGNVVGLYLSGPTATDVTARLATAFPELRWLRINCPRRSVSSDAVATLGAAEHLESVVFNGRHEPVTPALVQALTGAAGLREIEFRHVLAAGETLAALNGLTGLRRLRVSSAPGFADADARALVAIDQLAELDLSLTGVTDVCLDRLADMPNLRRLDVSQTAVTAAGVSRSRLRGRVDVRGAKTRTPAT
jgi:hypothetical protein